jgi:hypothetical protein
MEEFMKTYCTFTDCKKHMEGNYCNMDKMTHPEIEVDIKPFIYLEGHEDRLINPSKFAYITTYKAGINNDWWIGFQGEDSNIECSFHYSTEAEARKVLDEIKSRFAVKVG